MEGRKSLKTWVVKVVSLVVLCAPVLAAGEAIELSHIDTDIGSDFGRIAPDFSLPDVNGDLVTLAEFRGQDVLLVFGNTRCPHCAAGIPLFNELDGNEFKVVFVALGGTKETVGSYIEERNVKFQMLLDTDRSVGRKYNVQGVPTGYIIDQNGRVMIGGPEESSLLWTVLSGQDVPQLISERDENYCEDNTGSSAVSPDEPSGLAAVQTLSDLHSDFFGRITVTSKPKIDKTVIKKIEQNPDEFQRVILIFSKKPEGYKNFVNSLGGRVTHDYDIIEGIAVNLPGRAIGRLKELRNLVSIQEDRVVHAFLSESVPLINADDVWALGFDGSGKTVCIVDTGVDDSHPALNPLIAEKCYCSGNPGPKGCCPGKTEVGDDAMDDEGHGTHVAGIIASQDSTYKGVAPGADLMAVKVLDSTGSGWESDVIAGINWCSAQNADIISISLGGGLFSSYCDGAADAQAVNNAVDAGAVVSIASGNNGSTTQISAPACASKAISVGDVYDADVGGVGWGQPLLCQDTTTWADKIVCHSNRNNILDLLAPGALINSAKLGGGFIEYGGTSMAAPHVSGAAALLLEAEPNLTPAQVEATLKNTGVDIYDSGSGLTFPRIDVLAAISLPEMGYLEPYLIGPISDINVAQNEFFTFSSGVECVGGECGDVKATLDPEIELAYDDGTPDVFSDSAKYLGWGNPGGGFAVRFTPLSYPVKIKTVRFYVSGTTPFELHVWSDNNKPGSDLIAPFQVNPDVSENWFDIDLSSYNIEIISGDFYIGWIELSSTNYAGTDTTPPHDDRSWVYDGSSWALLSSYGAPYDDIDMMIRAVVETTKGVISTTVGAIPFYTTSSNPQTCTNMQSGDTCEQTWDVNATGEIGTSYKFFTFYEPVTYASYIDSEMTDIVTVTIVAELDVTAPAAITDLAATSGDGQVTLTWAAPGDDGDTGTATKYIVRYANSIIDTQEKFDAATDFANSWTPLEAGSGESHIVDGLTNEVLYYFAVETQDEVPNTSGLSNSPSATPTVPTAAPKIISTPVTVATAGQLYSYNVDANGIPAPTYSLIASPNNMTIDANTGLIEWTADANQLGSNAVSVRATNSEGFDEQNFNITVLPSDNFNDNKRGAMWRLFAEDYDNVRVVEDANRLTVRATGDVNDLVSSYVANGWSFDVNENFAVDVDFHYSSISEQEAWIGITIENDDGYVSISAGSDSNESYFYYETVVDGNIVFEQELRDSNDGTLYISYDADSNNLYLSHVGYGDANAYNWQTTPDPLQVQWTSPVEAAIGGGSNSVALSPGEAYLDNFKIVRARLMGWPPATDLDGDGFIGWGDVGIISKYWLADPNVEGDLNNDDIVNFLDFAEFGLAW